MDQQEARAEEVGGAKGDQQGPQEGGLPGPGPGPQQLLILTGDCLPRCCCGLVSGPGRKEQGVEVGTWAPCNQMLGSSREERELLSWPWGLGGGWMTRLPRCQRAYAGCLNCYPAMPSLWPTLGSPGEDAEREGTHGQGRLVAQSPES